VVPAHGEPGVVTCKWDPARPFRTTRIGEPVFVPAGAGEEGYVIAYNYDGDDTNLVVLHASDIAGEPAAVLRMPQRMPFGLQGCWASAQPS